MEIIPPLVSKDVESRDRQWLRGGGEESGRSNGEGREGWEEAGRRGRAGSQSGQDLSTEVPLMGSPKYSNYPWRYMHQCVSICKVINQ